MNDRLFAIIKVYHRSLSAASKVSLLEQGAEAIEAGALEPYEEDRIFEALKLRVAGRYGI